FILEPYMRIEKDTSIIVTEITKKDDFLIDLNKADTLDLQQLKGVGPSYARRIVKYRDMLGGYNSKKQLMEVYGMDSTRYMGFVTNIEVNSDSVIKIDINTATIKQMIKHPYIEFYMAKSIIKYREEIGGYTDLAQLLNAQLIYKELYDKIKPYLCLGNIK
ncbi:MAG: helix-hairpin-helix domain-containing protein, partial [Bacteroidales bacterium]|nr:helix-hairpin-helix domain-containing protein [Bacteroidales bacterium]